MKMLISLSLVIAFLIPTLAFADCVDLGGFTGWVAEGTHRIRFYEGERPIAIVNVPYCDVYPWSRIRLVRSYVCDSDSLFIDGEKCSIMTVQVLY